GARRAGERTALDSFAVETMSDGDIQLLQSGGDVPNPASRIIGGEGTGIEATRIPEELSILPLRGLVISPGTILPLTVSRPASIKLLDETLPLTKVIGLLAQRDQEKGEPGPNDLYHVGTA